MDFYWYAFVDTNQLTEDYTFSYVWFEHRPYGQTHLMRMSKTNYKITSKKD